MRGPRADLRAPLLVQQGSKGASGPEEEEDPVRVLTATVWDPQPVIGRFPITLQGSELSLLIRQSVSG